MACYINPMGFTQPTVKGDTIPIEGNGSAAYTTSATPETYTAVEGDDYASCWSTVAYKVSATPLARGITPAFESAYPANHVVQVPNLKVGTVITVTEL